MPRPIVCPSNGAFGRLPLTAGSLPVCALGVWVFCSLRAGAASPVACLSATACGLGGFASAFLLAIAAGAPLRFLASRRCAAAKATQDMVIGIRGVPALCWLPAGLLWGTVSFTAIVALAALVSACHLAPPSVRGTLAGLRAAWASTWQIMAAAHVVAAVTAMGSRTPSPPADTVALLVPALAVSAAGLAGAAAFTLLGDRSSRTRPRGNLPRPAPNGRDLLAEPETQPVTPKSKSDSKSR